MHTCYTCIAFPGLYNFPCTQAYTLRVECIDSALKSGAYTPDLLRSGVIDLALRRPNETEKEGGTGLESLPTTKNTEHTDSIVRLNFGNRQHGFVTECRRAARGTL